MKLSALALSYGCRARPSSRRALARRAIRGKPQGLTALGAGPLRHLMHLKCRVATPREPGFIRVSKQSRRWKRTSWVWLGFPPTRTARPQVKARRLCCQRALLIYIQYRWLAED